MTPAESIRYNALILAKDSLQSRGGGDADKVVEAAGKFEAFIKEGVKSE